MAVRFGRIRICRPCSLLRSQGAGRDRAVRHRGSRAQSAARRRRLLALADDPCGRERRAGAHRDRMVSPALAHRTAVPNPQAARAAHRAKRDRGRRSPRKARRRSRSLSPPPPCSLCWRAPLAARIRQPAACSTPEQIEVLRALQKKLQGRTLKQQNPHQPGSLGWAGFDHRPSRRLDRYDSDQSTGPITMRDGIERFNGIVDWLQTREKCVPKLAPRCGRATVLEVDRRSAGLKARAARARLRRLRP